MKTILLFLAIGVVSSMMLLKDVTPGDPIPGCDVKVGKKPPGGNALATTVTDTSGYFEFNNLEAGNGYYVEFGLATLGIDSSGVPTVIEGIGIQVSSATATEAKQKASEGKQKASEAKQKDTEAKQKDTRITHKDKMQSANKNSDKGGRMATATITRIFGNVEAMITVEGNSIRGTLRYKNE
ncbi:MAG: hypothetical protein IPL27_06645 [Lewinellaceae bacterium]|nr:hypothetical protein [Lewinellaceae bacterium]